MTCEGGRDGGDRGGRRGLFLFAAKSGATRGSEKREEEDDFDFDNAREVLLRRRRGNRPPAGPERTVTRSTFFSSSCVREKEKGKSFPRRDI